MKNTYYLLASLAVLFSMNAKAEELASKATEMAKADQKKKLSQIEQQVEKERELREKYGLPEMEAKAPICFGT